MFLLLLLFITAITAKVIEFSDTPLSCRSLQCPDGSSCMEMPEGAFCWPVFVKQTQVQASIDEPPAAIATTRPPKSSCSSINCAPDEQCVNAFDGPTCRRVTFDLSTKWITTTTPSSWSPESIEEPRTISVFVERSTPSSFFHSHTASPPAPPSSPHWTESKLNSAEMPPSSFRKPSVPNSCDIVHCPSGQTCFMKEVKCFTVPCHPVPYCK
ncbi:hypothetical protein PRIPAC_71432 [Pristionchus pacificus]|uniref:Uncharacterized protein n=1 Tax=Pristionchus pacificus TaxID=54126 RepID=A0A454XYD0_PRIPA|nr:hypothetical protein PRIPAC_71432 [Pristionchus pacificus]|eukprot:PDM75157.1 hypothetical protein PRIPAC_40538 [Pristionchus pacificus]